MFTNISRSWLFAILKNVFLPLEAKKEIDSSNLNWKTNVYFVALNFWKHFLADFAVYWFLSLLKIKEFL